MVSDWRGIGILDAGGIRNGGGRFYPGEEYGKHHYEESDGFLYRHMCIYFNRLWVAAWRGHGRFDWETGL